MPYPRPLAAGEAENLRALADVVRMVPSWEAVVKTSAELRAQADTKYRAAAMARRVGPGLSVAHDRASMLHHAQELEKEAAALEAEADAMDART